MIDPIHIESAKELLRLGQLTEFWKVVCDALDDSIAHLQATQDGEDMKELTADQYKLESELLKAKKKYLVHLKNLPATLISFLTEPAGNLEKPVNYDPYYSAQELQELMGKEL